MAPKTKQNQTKQNKKQGRNHLQPYIQSHTLSLTARLYSSLLQYLSSDELLYRIMDFNWRYALSGLEGNWGMSAMGFFVDPSLHDRSWSFKENKQKQKNNNNNKNLEKDRRRGKKTKTQQTKKVDKNKFN